jgi:hypothetical protein
MWCAHGNHFRASRRRSNSFVGWVHNGTMRTLLLAAVIVALAPQARQRPPASVPCATNDLTAYTGVVIAYQRGRDQTTMRIRTDWDTTEDVTLSHAAAGDPRDMFRYAGKPFTVDDWARIELPGGLVRPNTRATAWVCGDRTVLVDWAVPKEG